MEYMLMINLYKLVTDSEYFGNYLVAHDCFWFVNRYWYWVVRPHCAKYHPESLAIVETYHLQWEVTAWTLMHQRQGAPFAHSVLHGLASWDC